jgi:GT2 family glycosyltransferase
MIHEAARRSAAPGTLRQCILVLGMHRSGTSALTRELSLLGAAVPNHFLAGDANNKKGYWESSKLLALHKEMEIEFGSRWDDWRGFDIDKRGTERLAHYKREIARIIVEEEFNDAPLFIIKDPRICRFVPLYEEILSTLKIKPLYVLAFRNPLAVFKSLEARDGMTTSSASFLWLRHVLDAEAATRGKPRAVISYEGLLADWRKAVDHVGECLKLTWPRPPQDASADSEAFLSHELRHHSASADDLAARPDLSAWVKDTYRALLILERGHDVMESYATLDSVRTEFDAAARLVGNAPFDSETMQQAAYEQNTEQIFAENAAHIKKLERLIAEHAVRVKKLDQLIATHSERVRKLEHILGSKQAELVFVRKQLAEFEKIFNSPLQLFVRFIHRLADVPRRLKQRSIKLLRNKRDRKAIVRSGLFDAAWYLSQNPDISTSGVEPLTHYLNHGALEGRSPNPQFDTVWYLSQNRDVAQSRINPLAHYALHGAAEGRNPNPSFDSRWYLAQNRDVVSAGMNPLTHYLRHGSLEGRLSRAQPGFGMAAAYFPMSQRYFLGHVETNKDSAEPHHSPVDALSITLDALLPSRQIAAEPAGNRRVDVIIPIYDGFEETRRCIESILVARSKNLSFGRLILVDDCGPSVPLREYLSDIATRDGVLLMKNPVNMGFVASVNRAMAAVSPRDDMILLNSDTEVSGNWVDRLTMQADADEKIGTVTPFSNNATICSFPNIPGHRDLPPGLNLQAIDAACAKANTLRAVDLPTGVGSCMFIKRACFDEIGSFDEKAFGAGYGEETDFCLRASKRGWRNVLAGDVFVFHVGETSFGESSIERKARATTIINGRYPDYLAAVAAWVKMDPALPLRLAVTAALWQTASQPVVLHILHGWGGGSEKHVAELASKLSPAARNMVLIAVRSTTRVQLLLLLQEASSWQAIDFSTNTLAEIAPFLASFGVSQVHVHQAIQLFDEMPTFLRRMNVPYDLSIHDYAWICPRINLFVAGSYCGEPDATGCLACLAGDGMKFAGDILWWRQKGTKLIAEADRVICPSIDVAQRIRRYVPNGKFIVVPHEENLYRPGRVARIPDLAPNEPLRVAVLGILNEQKGGTFLLDCIEAARKDAASIEWRVIGEFESSFQERVRDVGNLLHVTGRYKPDDLPHLFGEFAPHVVFFSQRWPETYSYTLSEALNADCAILAPDIGAFSERIADKPWCWLYPLETTPHQLAAQLMTIRDHIERNAPPRPTSDKRKKLAGNEWRRGFYSNNYLR